MSKRMELGDIWENGRKTGLRLVMAIVIIIYTISILNDLGFIPFGPIFGKIIPIDGVNLLILVSLIAIFFLVEGFFSVEKKINVIEGKLQASEVVNLTQLEFKTRLEAILKESANLTFIGNGSIEYLSKINDHTDKKNIDVYISFENASHNNYIKNIFTNKNKVNNITVYHMNYDTWNSLIIGKANGGNKVDVLMFTNNSHRSDFAGCHIHGNAAKEWMINIDNNVINKKLVKIDGMFMVNYILRIKNKNKTEYLLKLDDLENGTPIQHDDDLKDESVKRLCDCMSRNLEKKNSLRVTHICTKETIELFTDANFKSWVNANYATIKDRAGWVERIFIVSKNDIPNIYENKLMMDMMNEMYNNGVRVKYFYINENEIHKYEDFSIYGDDESVIFIFQNAQKGGWISNKVTVSSRYSKDANRVKEYVQIFENYEAQSETYVIKDNIANSEKVKVKS
jgi:hypothetical protein